MTHDTLLEPGGERALQMRQHHVVTLVSSTCMKATTITERVMAHFRADEIRPASGVAATAALLSATAPG